MVKSLPAHSSYVSTDLIPRDRQGSIAAIRLSLRNVRADQWGVFLVQRLEPEEWAGLSTVERARRCRTMASEAQRLSRGAEGEVRNVYFALSVHWMALANEIERSDA